MRFSDALQRGKVDYIKDKVVDQYLSAVSKTSVLPDNIPCDVSIVYTPLNGTGISCVPQCLKRNGFSNIIIPKEQSIPDGRFPTCPSPNPEERAALKVGLKKAKQMNCELLLATDPDCDRVGAAVRQGEEYVLINGNEMGVLLLDFICKMRLYTGTLPEHPVAVKTIVTTPMADRIAKHYQIELREVLTGFKFIGEQICYLEKKGHAEDYIFGFEESYGYLSGTYVRDKDAVNASLLICEMFAFYKAKGKSLIDVLHQLYDQYGFYKNRLLSFVFDGSAGLLKIQGLMDSLRKKRPQIVSGYNVKKVIDYQTDETGLPCANVIRFYLEEGIEAVVRPSGTEPKLKVYISAVNTSEERCNQIIERLVAAFNQWIKIGCWIK